MTETNNTPKLYGIWCNRCRFWWTGNDQTPLTYHTEEEALFHLEGHKSIEQCEDDVVKELP